MSKMNEKKNQITVHFSLLKNKDWTYMLKRSWYLTFFDGKRISLINFKYNFPLISIHTRKYTFGRQNKITRHTTKKNWFIWRKSCLCNTIHNFCYLFIEVLDNKKEFQQTDSKLIIMWCKCVVKSLLIILL